jgi:hypothetical protein
VEKKTIVDRETYDSDDDVLEDDDRDAEFQQRIAVAMYPTASLVNHSCTPNTIVSFKYVIILSPSHVYFRV